MEPNLDFNDTFLKISYEEGKKSYRVETNTFVLNSLTKENLKYALYPFIQVTPDPNLKLVIDLHGLDDTEEEKENLFNYIIDIYRSDTSVHKFKKELHPIVVSYYWNIANKREKFSLDPLRGFLKGKPVLFIGAGPSLELHLGELRELLAERKFFVITGGTGIKMLAEHGIVPDLCLAIDPYDTEFERFKDLPEDFQKKTVLLTYHGLNPKCFDGWKGPLICARGLEGHALGRIIEDMPDYAIGCEVSIGAGSVTTWLLELLEVFEAGDLYMLGVDMVPKAEGVIYAFDQTFSDTTLKKHQDNWRLEMRLMVARAAKYRRGIWNLGSLATEIPGIVKIPFQEVKLPTITAPKIKLKPHTMNVRAKLLKFRNDLEHVINRYHFPEFHQSPVYKDFLHPYCLVCEWFYWRTREYPVWFLNAVVRANIAMIDDILVGKPYVKDATHAHVSWQ